MYGCQTGTKCPDARAKKDQVDPILHAKKDKVDPTHFSHDHRRQRRHQVCSAHAYPERTSVACHPTLPHR
jgi:hypothetical protein